MSTPLDPGINQEFWNNVNRIAAQPNSLPSAQPKFTYPKPININVPYPTLQNGNGGSYFNGSSAPAGDSLSRLMHAIRSQESSGNYGAINSSTGAEGAYQMLPENEQAWSASVFGKAVPEQEFLRNQAIQDRVAQYMLGKYLSQYGVAGAAAAWYGGPGAVSRMYDKTPYGNYPSMYDYVQSILSKYGG